MKPSPDVVDRPKRGSAGDLTTDLLHRTVPASVSVRGAALDLAPV